MKLKHISIIIKLIKYLNIKKLRKSFFLKLKKEFLPIIVFLKKESFIYNYKVLKKKYIYIFLKYTKNFNLIKNIKVFNLKKNDFKKVKFLKLLKYRNYYFFYILFTPLGILSINTCLKKNIGGFLLIYIKY